MAEQAVLDWSARTARELLRRSFGSTHPPSRPLDGGPELTASLQRCERNVTMTEAGLAVFLGALAATKSVFEDQLQARAVDADRIGEMRRGLRHGDGWSGFVPTSSGWVSLALGGREERERFHTCLAGLSGRPLRSGALDIGDLDAATLSSALQEWGIACLPVRPAAFANCVGGQWGDGDAMAAIASQLRPRLMLAGVRIVSFGQLISAPLAAALFRACGAEVVAVAHPRRLDSVVYGPMPQPLDLASRDGRREAARLCRRADLVLGHVRPQNRRTGPFRHHGAPARPRVWTNLGLVPSELSGVHLSLPAFPWRDTLRRNFKAYGFQMEALFGAGLQPVRTVGGPVTAPRSALLDHSVGLSAFVAGAGTLLSGRVGRVELSHVDVLAAAGVGAS